MVYLPSAYAIPIGSFQVPQVPPTVPPNEGPFLYVPVNCAWLPFICGALLQLLLQATWDCDADTLTKVQGWVFDMIAMFNCATAATLDELCGQLPDGGCDMGCACLRYQDGVLQMLDCGTWKDVPGQNSNAGNGSNGQPATGAPQPPYGGCQDYGGTIVGPSNYLIPTPVSTGDVVSLLSSKGAMNPGSALWYLASGHQSFGGEDIPITFNDAGAIDPSSAYGALIMLINGVYYPLGFLGAITIPSGVSNVQPILLQNATVGATPQGQWSIQVQVCNNQPSAWTHTFDLTRAPLPSDFFAFHPGSSGPRGIWVSGTGYIPNPSSGGTSAPTLIQFDISGLPTEIWGPVTWNLASGLPSGGHWQWTVDTTDLTENSSGEASHTTNEPTSGAPTFIGVDALDGNPSPTWTSLTLGGIGTNPFAE